MREEVDRSKPKSAGIQPLSRDEGAPPLDVVPVAEATRLLPLHHRHVW